MAQVGISGAGKAKAFSIVLLFLVLAGLAESHYKETEHEVKWDFRVEKSWSDGTSLGAGEFLVFKYPVGHNVVKVDKSGYDKCSASGNFHPFTTGNDRIKLHRGTNYFICSIGTHCGAGMKIAVKAK